MYLWGYGVRLPYQQSIVSQHLVVKNMLKGPTVSAWQQRDLNEGLLNHKNDEHTITGTVSAVSIASCVIIGSTIPVAAASNQVFSSSATYVSTVII